MQSNYQLHIDGKDVDARSGETLAVENPATGEVVTHVAVAGPEDVDAAVVYFMSDQSRFVTGQVLAVDGGWSVSEGQT